MMRPWRYIERHPQPEDLPTLDVDASWPTIVIAGIAGRQRKGARA